MHIEDKSRSCWDIMEPGNSLFKCIHVLKLVFRKSTTFSVISGSTTVSAGNVYICKEDIQSKLSDCQRQIGYCPQNNPLFGRLTVREHLNLYARLKTMQRSSTLDSEIEMIAQQVQLKTKLDEVCFFLRDSNIKVRNNFPIFL